MRTRLRSKHNAISATLMTRVPGDVYG